MSTPLNITIAGPADARRLAGFARQAFMDAYGGSDPAKNVTQYADKAFAVAVIDEDLRDTETTVLIATSTNAAGNDKNTIAGYVTLRHGRPIDELDDPAPAQLERIYVDSGCHGAGIGGELLRAAIAAATDSGAATIWLSVWQENQRAQAFYERHGFASVGETFFMMGSVREDDFVYARRLGDN